MAAARAARADVREPTARRRFEGFLHMVVSFAVALRSGDCSRPGR